MTESDAPYCFICIHLFLNKHKINLVLDKYLKTILSIIRRLKLRYSFLACFLSLPVLLHVPPPVLGLVSSSYSYPYLTVSLTNQRLCLEYYKTPTNHSRRI